MKKTIIIVVSVLILITGGLFIFIYNFSHKSLPDYNTDIKLEGMLDEVEIYRDEFAIPHIYAKNEMDLYRAVGYVMAQDRLWQMDLIRRATQGRLSEIFGEDYVDIDLMLRSLRISEKSKMVMNSADKEMIASLNAFADGVNQYIENNPKKLPIEFKILKYKPDDWTVENSLNIIGYMAWDLGTAWSAEVVIHQLKEKLNEEQYKSLIPNHTETTYIYENKIDTNLLEIESKLIGLNEKIHELGVTTFGGSNNWVVSGKKSETGMPILANDMHLTLNVPGTWYQIHLVLEDQYNVTGLAVPGAPAVVAGHNEHIAWGMTNVMLDDMDFYLETINPENNTQYKFNGEWKDMKVQKEIIKTKDGNEFEKEILFTHRGPIISDFKNVKEQAISMRWLGNEPSNELRAIYLLNRAKNWNDFRSALTTFVCVSQNIVYADVEGNIGIQLAAGVPIRKGDHFSIYPGDTDEYDWTGLVPFDSLPQEFNPERGFASSANNKSAPEDYPYYISHYFYQPYRIDRINEMLQEKEKLSVTDFQAMQSDFNSKLVEKFLTEIIFEVSKINSEDEIINKSVKILTRWDGKMNAESSAAAIFEQFYIIFIKNMIADEMETELYKKYVKYRILANSIFEYTWQNPYSSWCDDITTSDKKESFEYIVQKSYIETIDTLKQQLGNNPEKWEWGKIHTFELAHPLSKVKILNTVFKLNRGSYQLGGSHHTVCPYSYSFIALFNVNHGASHRHIFPINDWDNCLTILPTGNSGQSASEHYCDQTELYINNKYHKDLFSKESVQENYIYKMTIKN